MSVLKKCIHRECLLIIIEIILLLEDIRFYWEAPYSYLPHCSISIPCACVAIKRKRDSIFVLAQQQSYFFLFHWIYSLLNHSYFKVHLFMIYKLSWGIHVKIHFLVNPGFVHYHVSLKIFKQISYIQYSFTYY